MIVGVIPQKQPAEILTPSIDFTHNLFGGSVSSAVATARNFKTGADVTATFLDAPNTTISSPFVTVILGTNSASDVGQTFIVTVIATMSGGQVIEDEIIVCLVEL